MHRHWEKPTKSKLTVTSRHCFSHSNHFTLQVSCEDLLSSFRSDRKVRLESGMLGSIAASHCHPQPPVKLHPQGFMMLTGDTGHQLQGPQYTHSTQRPQVHMSVEMGARRGQDAADTKKHRLARAGNTLLPQEPRLYQGRPGHMATPGENFRRATVDQTGLYVAAWP